MSWPVVGRLPQPGGRTGRPVGKEAMFDLDPAVIGIRVLVMIVAFTIHELAHAVVADRLGDPTPRRMGRLTLNPAAHLHPVGSLMLLLVGFGWARPVPVNPLNLRGDRHASMALVAAAGPLSNVALAMLAALPLRLATVAPLAEAFLAEFIFINLALAFFNIIPIPPLDGFKVLLGGLPARAAEQLQPMEQFGFLIVIAVIYGVPGFTTVLVVRPALALLALLTGRPELMW
jgi:Zn-dependent protease